ncbi:MAG: hypothetical protein HY910_13375 [Desulfarculus sp.]|nr:hypothetical protein [Desulfarculus sp.]
MRRARALVPAVGLLAILALGLLAGCQKLQNLKEEFDPRLSQADQAYQGAVEPYLAQGVVRGGPATEMQAKALPLTPTVRRAWAQRAALAQSLDQAATAQLLAQEEAEAAKGLEVVLSLYVPERQWSDLTAPRPDWRVFIQDGAGQRLEPQDIRLIRERERSALNQSLYYFWGPWDRLFRVRFDRPAPPARLVITGAPGRVEMPLKLD